MQRRSFIKGILGTSAISAVSTVEGKELESLLVPNKEILLPIKFKGIVNAKEFEPPFLITAWYWTSDDRNAIRIHAQFRTPTEIAQLQELAFDKAFVSWDLPVRTTGCEHYSTIRVFGQLESSFLDTTPETFTEATVLLSVSWSQELYG